MSALPNGEGPTEGVKRLEREANHNDAGTGISSEPRLNNQPRLLLWVCSGEQEPTAREKGLREFLLVLVDISKRRRRDERREKGS